MMTTIELSAEAAQILTRILMDRIISLQERVEANDDDMASMREDRDWWRNRAERHSDRIADLEIEISRLKNRIPMSEFDFSTLEGYDKIPAIKAFRDATGAGLKESKDAVEQAEAKGLFRFRSAFQTAVKPIIELDIPTALDASK